MPVAESLDNLIMAKFTRLEVAMKMVETGMVPLFYHGDIEVAKKVIVMQIQKIGNNLRNLFFKNNL